MIPQSALSFNVLHFDYIHFYHRLSCTVANGWHCHQTKRYCILQAYMLFFSTVRTTEMTTKKNNSFRRVAAAFLFATAFLFAPEIPGAFLLADYWRLHHSCRARTIADGLLITPSTCVPSLRCIARMVCGPMYPSAVTPDHFWMALIRADPPDR